MNHTAIASVLLVCLSEVLWQVLPAPSSPSSCSSVHKLPAQLPSTPSSALLPMWATNTSKQNQSKTLIRQVSPAPRPLSSCNSDGKLPAELKPTICTQADKDDWSPSQQYSHNIQGLDFNLSPWEMGWRFNITFQDCETALTWQFCYFCVLC